MISTCELSAVRGRCVRSPDSLRETIMNALNGYDIEGNRLECRATTRRGTPCQRTPLPQNGYCPSHQHLAETEELEAPLAA